jgi:hypothetical protein
MVSSFPMAMVFSELGLQNLLNGLVGSDVPFASKLNVGPYGINFFPLGRPHHRDRQRPQLPRAVRPL